MDASERLVYAAAFARAIGDDPYSPESAESAAISAYLAVCALRDGIGRREDQAMLDDFRAGDRTIVKLKAEIEELAEAIQALRREIR
jgi:hypothetical protein